MSATTIAFFNNKGGVGKTSLVHHLSWMFSRLGVRTVAADLDPQANLTSAFLDENLIERLWAPDPGLDSTVFTAIRPMLKGIGDILEETPVHEINDSLTLLPGDLRLSGFEDELSQKWPSCLGGDERAFRVESAFWRVLQKAAEAFQSSLVLMDLGPNLGALNRAALIAADYVVVPLAPDLFSLQGLSNLGPTLRKWRADWKDRLERRPDAPDLDLPAGAMRPLGYVVMQHSIRFDRPTRAYERWIAQIPSVYHQDVLGEEGETTASVMNDPHALALLKPYRTLMPLAQQARKPIFMLTAADGATGAHYTAAKNVEADFEALGRKIADKAGITLPPPTNA